MSILAEDAAKQIVTFLRLERQQGSDEVSLPLENLSELYFPWLAGDYFHYCDAVAAVGRYRGEARSLQASDAGVPATTPTSYVDVTRQRKWDLADLYVAGEPIDYIFLMARFTE